VVARGEIWWYEAPHRKRRPYLIVTRDEAIPALTALVGVPVTSSLRNIPSEVTLSRRDGMPMDCALSFDNVETISKTYLTRRIVSLPWSRWLEICEAFRFSISC
jgi:mRNA interferase MazF